MGFDYHHRGALDLRRSRRCACRHSHRWCAGFHDAPGSSVDDFCFWCRRRWWHVRHFQKHRTARRGLGWPLEYQHPSFHSWWSIVAILLAHIPLGLLPHIGNKLWALKNDNDRYRFVKLAFGVGLTLGLLGLGGILARAILGDELLMPGRTANEALPALFIELFPTWFAALIGIGILAAIMSTADGLVVSSSQILANDIYRRSIVPAFHSHLSDEEVDRRVLLISRWSTVGVLIMCMFMAWALQNKNIALLVWIGSGGMMAAFAGPLVMGAIWRGVTKAGAYAGMICGMTTFITLHSGILGNIVGPESTYPLSGVIRWLATESPNPFSCAAIGELVSVGVTWGVSKLTQPLPEEYVESMFGSDEPEKTNIKG